MTPEDTLIAKAEAFTKKHMTGTRKGSDRPSWCHPEDVVRLVNEAYSHCTTPFLPQDRARGVAAAWMHDLIEDTAVTTDLLRAEGFDDQTVQMVAELTKFPDMVRSDYFLGLRYAPTLTRVIKVCDRIANLTEGKGVLSDKWWLRYSIEALDKVLPLAYNTPCEAWLVTSLKAITSP